MSLTNPNTPVSQQDLQDFYHKILPYMGGSSTGGGHTIEDAEGTDLTQRDTLQFGEGFLAEDDDTNEKTVITPDVMQSGDMDDVLTPLPSVQPNLPVLYDDSGTEYIVGKAIINNVEKNVYRKTTTISPSITIGTNWVNTNISSSNMSLILSCTAHRPIGSLSGLIYPLVANTNGGNGVEVVGFKELNEIYAITVEYTKTTD